MDDQAKKRNVKYYTRRVRGGPLVAGDRVLVRECAFDGPHKLKDKWSESIFVVVSKPHDSIPVYRVREESGGRVRTMHRNLLLPVQSIRDPLSLPPILKAPVPSVTEPSTPVRALPDDPPRVDSNADDALGEDSESEEEALVGRPGQQREVPQTRPDPHIPTPTSTILPSPVPTMADPVTQSPPTQSPSAPIPAPRPMPRASSRQRQPPSWQTSGDFVMDFGMSANPKVQMLLCLLENPHVDKPKVTEALLLVLLA